jgi:hypothetical protein
VFGCHNAFTLHGISIRVIHFVSVLVSTVCHIPFSKIAEQVFLYESEGKTTDVQIRTIGTSMDKDKLGNILGTDH